MTTRKSKLKEKIFALTYHPRKENWSAKEVSSMSAKVGRNTSLMKGKTPNDALAKLSEKSYKSETGRNLNPVKKKLHRKAVKKAVGTSSWIAKETQLY